MNQNEKKKKRESRKRFIFHLEQNRYASLIDYLVGLTVTRSQLTRIREGIQVMRALDEDNPNLIPDHVRNRLREMFGGLVYTSSSNVNSANSELDFSADQVDHSTVDFDDDF